MKRSHDADSFPIVNQDDFLKLLTGSTETAWHELARDQPELAREIEQQAVRLRLLLEAHEINPIEAQKLVIDTAVFASEALIHAYKRGSTLPETPTTGIV